MAIGANNLLMLALSNYRRKLFDLQTFQNQAHIISVTGIIIYFLGTYYLYHWLKAVESPVIILLGMGGFESENSPERQNKMLNKIKWS